MRKAEKSDLAEDGARQLLPGAAILKASSASTLGAGLSLGPKPAPSSVESIRPQTTIPIAFDLPALEEQPVPIASQASPPTPLPTASAIDLDHVQTFISHRAVEIRRTQAEVMDVVLRPNAQTELALHLSLEDGTVAVVAEFRQGDFNGLSADWGQLQDSLSTQGIRLGALQPSNPPEDSGQASTGGFNQSSRQPIPEPELPATSASKAPLPPNVPNHQNNPGPQVPTARRRWESWA